MTVVSDPALIEMLVTVAVSLVYPVGFLAGVLLAQLL
jgi:hypothetical protein